MYPSTLSTALILFFGDGVPLISSMPTDDGGSIVISTSMLRLVKVIAIRKACKRDMNAGD